MKIGNEGGSSDKETNQQTKEKHTNMRKTNDKDNMMQLRTLGIQLGIVLMALEGNRVESRG